jgi:nucleoside triphosphate pyrophosphatase
MSLSALLTARGAHPHALSLAGAAPRRFPPAARSGGRFRAPLIGYYQHSMHLILASASPRRAELLASAGFHFDVVPADVDETPNPAEKPQEYALRVALNKAVAVGVTRQDPGSVVLGADTVVVAAGEILGKPKDSADARRMLRLLSGTAHVVLTAVVIKQQAIERTAVITTRVWFQPLSDSEIAWYVDSGEPEGKAGAYGIQGRAARFIERIDGSWSNVVGLPVATVYQLLKALDVIY